MVTKLDLVYIIGTESKWNDNELRYSLRSLVKFAQDFRYIYIIGHCPDFINRDKITWYEYSDFTNSVSQNILDKILYACNIQGISENFIVLNDDYFFTKKVSLINYPYYHTVSLFNYTLKQVGYNNWYRENLVNTYEFLINRNYGDNTVEEPKYWDLHYPIIYNKDLFQAVFNNKFKLPNDKFCIKTIYCHILNITGKYRDDNKIREEISPQKFAQMITKREVFSTGDEFLTETLKSCIERLYPNKSIYEK